MNVIRLPEMSRHLLAGVAILLLPVACGRGFAPPPVPVGSRPAEEQARLELGHEVHQAKCATCHLFVDPASYDPADLRDEIIPMMGRKAGLSSAEKQAVLDYLLVVRNSRAQR